MTIRFSAKRKKNAAIDLQSNLNTSFNIQFDEIQQNVKINASKVDTRLIVDTIHTLEAGDEGRLLEINSEANTTITIPPDSVYNFPVGTQIDIIRIGTGQVFIEGANNVVVDAAENAFTLRTQFSAAGLIKRSANRWIIIGDTIP